MDMEISDMSVNNKDVLQACLCFYLDFGPGLGASSVPQIGVGSYGLRDVDWNVD